MTRHAIDRMSRAETRLKHGLDSGRALDVGIARLRSEAAHAIQKGYLEAEERQALAALVVSLAALLRDDVVS
jgi:hypothetical protein